MKLDKTVFLNRAMKAYTVIKMQKNKKNIKKTFDERGSIW